MKNSLFYVRNKITQQYLLFMKSNYRVLNNIGIFCLNVVKYKLSIKLEKLDYFLEISLNYSEIG